MIRSEERNKIWGKPSELLGFCHVFDDAIDELVVPSFIGGHEIIPVCISLDFFQGMSRVVNQDFIQPQFHSAELISMDHDVLSSPLHARKRLVDHDTGVRQCVALALGAGRQQ